HRNKVIPPKPGSSFNSGGLMYPVTVQHVPPIYIADLVVRPDARTGQIAVEITVRNATGAPASSSVGASVTPAAGGDVLARRFALAILPPGDSTHRLSISVAQPRRWNLDDPYLYRVEALVAAGTL